jgi:hypothetical protein
MTLALVVVGCSARPLPIDHTGAPDGADAAADAGPGNCATRCELGRPAALFHCGTSRACGLPCALCVDPRGPVVGCVFDDGAGGAWACCENC